MNLLFGAWSCGVQLKSLCLDKENKSCTLYSTYGSGEIRFLLAVGTKPKCLVEMANVMM